MGYFCQLLQKITWLRFSTPKSHLSYLFEDGLVEPLGTFCQHPPEAQPEVTLVKNILGLRRIHHTFPIFVL